MIMSNGHQQVEGVVYPLDTGSVPWQLKSSQSNTADTFQDRERERESTFTCVHVSHYTSGHRRYDITVSRPTKYKVWKEEFSKMLKRINKFGRAFTKFQMRWKAVAHIITNHQSQPHTGVCVDCETLRKGSSHVEPTIVG